MLRRHLAAFPLALLVLTGCTGAHEDPVQPVATEIKVASGELDVPEFEEALRQPNVVILDVRTPAEFAQGHLEGARNLDIYSPSFLDEVAKLTRDRPYVIYCKKGIRSLDALLILTSQGVLPVAHLKGGIDEWQRQGKPVAT